MLSKNTLTEEIDETIQELEHLKWMVKLFISENYLDLTIDKIVVKDTYIDYGTIFRTKRFHGYVFVNQKIIGVKMRISFSEIYKWFKRRNSEIDKKRTKYLESHPHIVPLSYSVFEDEYRIQKDSKQILKEIYQTKL